MRKGVILDVDEQYVTLITPDGEFLRTRKLQQEYQIGEEIHFFPVEAGVKRDKSAIVFTLLNSVKGRVLAFTAAILFLAAALFPMYESRQVYAYMSIDANPSLELGLNEALDVISIEGYNEAGDKVIASLSDWKFESAVVVADKIIGEIENQGYLEEEKNVLISTAPSDDQQKVNAELHTAITEIKKAMKDEAVEVTVINGTVKDRESAVKQGVTTGAYKQAGKMKNVEYKANNYNAPLLKEKQGQQTGLSKESLSPKNNENNSKNDNKKTEKETKPNQNEEQAMNPAQQGKAPSENREIKRVESGPKVNNYKKIHLKKENNVKKENSGKKESNGSNTNNGNKNRKE